MSQFDGFNDYRQDQDQESGRGIDLDFGEGRIITIHRAGGSNSRYAKVFAEKTAPFIRRGRLKKLDIETDDRLMREVYAEAVIIGWKGITSNGKPVEFNVPNVLSFLEEMPEVFLEIRVRASDASKFLQTRMEEDAESLGNG